MRLPRHFAPRNDVVLMVRVDVEWVLPRSAKLAQAVGADPHTVIASDSEAI